MPIFISSSSRRSSILFRFHSAKAGNETNDPSGQNPLPINRAWIAAPNSAACGNMIMASDHGTKTIFAAAGANLGIAAAKFVAATVTGSSAMISEAVHSLVDTGNEMLLFIGVKVSKAAA
jgi:Co/Zn/Cd efflux system component